MWKHEYKYFICINRAVEYVNFKIEKRRVGGQKDKKINYCLLARSSYHQIRF